MGEPTFPNDFAIKSETTPIDVDGEEQDIGEEIRAELKKYGTGKPTFELITLKRVDD